MLDLIRYIISAVIIINGINIIRAVVKGDPTLRFPYTFKRYHLVAYGLYFLFPMFMWASASNISVWVLSITMVFICRLHLCGFQTALHILTSTKRDAEEACAEEV